MLHTITMRFRDDHAESTDDHLDVATEHIEEVYRYCGVSDIEISEVRGVSAASFQVGGTLDVLMRNFYREVGGITLSSLYALVSIVSEED